MSTMIRRVQLIQLLQTAKQYYNNYKATENVAIHVDIAFDILLFKKLLSILKFVKIRKFFLKIRKLRVLKRCVCKLSSGWIRYDNHIHITQPSAKYMYLIVTFRSPTANFIRHIVT